MMEFSIKDLASFPPRIKCRVNSGGNPDSFPAEVEINNNYWIPAFAGMTKLVIFHHTVL